MVDPTSELNENVDEADAPSCAVCGEVLTKAPEHRVLTRIEAGEVRTEHFCDDECREAWDA